MTQGRGAVGGLRYQAIATPAEVTHVPYDVAFQQKFRGPAIFGSIATFAGSDPAHLRQFSHVAAKGSRVGL